MSDLPSPVASPIHFWAQFIAESKPMVVPTTHSTPPTVRRLSAKSVLKHTFIQAVERMDIPEIFQCLEAGIDVNQKLPSEQTLIQIFLRKTHLEGLQRLIPFHPLLPTDSRKDWFDFSMKKMDWALIDVLLELGFKDNTSELRPDGELQRQDNRLITLSLLQADPKFPLQCGNFILTWLDRQNIHTSGDLNKRVIYPKELLAGYAAIAAEEGHVDLLEKVKHLEGGPRLTQNQDPENAPLSSRWGAWKQALKSNDFKKRITFLIDHQYVPPAVYRSATDGPLISFFWDTGVKATSPCFEWFIQSPLIQEQLKKDLSLTPTPAPVFSFCSYAPHKVLSQLNQLHSLASMANQNQETLVHKGQQGVGIGMLNQDNVLFLIQEGLDGWLSKSDHQGKTPFDHLKERSRFRGAQLEKFYEKHTLKSEVLKIENKQGRFKKLTKCRM